MEEKKNKENEERLPDWRANPPENIPMPTEDLNQKDTRLLDRAFAVIREHIDRGHAFTYDQMDTGIEISLPVLPKPDQELFKELAKTNNVPLWQANWAQFRRSHEQGMAFTLFLDPGWRSGDIYGLSPEICEECGKTFTPERFKSKLCSNKCGAEVERRRLGLPTIAEQLRTLEVGKSQEQRVQEEDRAMIEQGAKKAGPITSPVV